MITLGIESSCDETSVALVRDGKKVLSNIIFSSQRRHKKYGGVVPEIASRVHVEAWIPCLDEALKKARVSERKIDLVAVTQGPGLLGSLLVGLSAAKSMAYALNKPLIGVDHVIAHAYAGRLSDPSLRFPFLSLVASGGHTLLLRMDSARRVRILGRTIDDAAGEAFDKVAKMLGLGYPGGPEVDRLSRGQDPSTFKFTRPFLSNDSLDFSFSGIKTAVFYKIKEISRKKSLPLKTKRAICAGFQEAVCDVLVAKTLRAARHQKLGSVVIGGGVSANRRLREKFLAAGRKEGLKAVFPAREFCLDNAAMIAGLGSALYKEGQRSPLTIESYPNFLRDTQARLTSRQTKRRNR